MPVYRAYIVGLHDRPIGMVQLDCIDDGSAITSAKRLVDSHDVELLADGKACSQVRRPVQTDVQKIGEGDELTSMAMLRSSHGMSAGGQKRKNSF